jgi:hypothetical protein
MDGCPERSCAAARPRGTFGTAETIVMQPENRSSQLELVVRCDGATLEEARTRAREMYGTRAVVREVIVAAGGQFTVKLSAESEPQLREREERALPAGATVKERRLVHPRYEVLREVASSEDDLRANVRLAHPHHRVVSIVCEREPATGIIGIGKHPGEYEVTIIDTQLRSEVSYEVRSCVEVVVAATPADCLAILREPATGDHARTLAAARSLAEQADPSHGDAILDAIDKFRRDENIYPALARALERIATPPLIDQLLARWAPPLAEWQSWQEDNHLRAVAGLLSRVASSAPGFEALARCLRSPEIRVRTSARAFIQRLENVPVPPSARPYMQEYEKQYASEVRAWLDENHPGIVDDRFCMDLLGKLAEREMRVSRDRDELSDWCRERGLTRDDGETLANVLVSAGLAVNPSHASYGITDNGRSLVGASLFGR